MKRFVLCCWAPWGRSSFSHPYKLPITASFSGINENLPSLRYDLADQTDHGELQGSDEKIAADLRRCGRREKQDREKKANCLI